MVSSSISAHQPDPEETDLGHDLDTLIVHVVPSNLYLPMYIYLLFYLAKSLLINVS